MATTKSAFSAISPSFIKITTIKCFLSGNLVDISYKNQHHGKVTNFTTITTSYTSYFNSCHSFVVTDITSCHTNHTSHFIGSSSYSSDCIASYRNLSCIDSFSFTSHSFSYSSSFGCSFTSCHNLDYSFSSNYSFTDSSNSNHNFTSNFDSSHSFASSFATSSFVTSYHSFTLVADTDYCP